MIRSNPDQRPSASDVIDSRARDWERRSDKWHAALVAERRWSQSGVAVPPVVLGLATLLIALGMPRQALITAAAGFISSVVALRAHFGRQRLDADKTELAWVTADRMAEAYRSLRARADGAESYIALLQVSDRLESRARFGIPRELANELEQAAAPACEPSGSTNEPAERHEGWISFCGGGALPPERKPVLLKLSAIPLPSSQPSEPESVVLGYLRIWSNGPWWVTPGFDRGNRAVLAWRDCLPDDMLVARFSGRSARRSHLESGGGS